MGLEDEYCRGRVMLLDLLSYIVSLPPANRLSGNGSYVKLVILVGQISICG